MLSSTHYSRPSSPARCAPGSRGAPNTAMGALKISTFFINMFFHIFFLSSHLVQRDPLIGIFPQQLGDQVARALGHVRGEPGGREQLNIPINNLVEVAKRIEGDVFCSQAKCAGGNVLEVDPGNSPVSLVVVLRLKRWLAHLEVVYLKYENQ